jgi:hypothetical protein
VLRIIRTTAVLTLGLVLFRSNTLANAGVFFVKIFSDWSFSIDYLTKTFAGLNIDLLGAFTAILLFVLMIFVDRLIMEPRGKDVLAGDKAVSVHFNYVYVVWLIAAAWLLLIANGQSSGFIYFQF